MLDFNLVQAVPLHPPQLIRVLTACSSKRNKILAHAGYGRKENQVAVSDVCWHSYT